MLSEAGKQIKEELALLMPVACEECDLWFTCFERTKVEGKPCDLQLTIAESFLTFHNLCVKKVTIRPGRLTKVEYIPLQEAN